MTSLKQEMRQMFEKRSSMAFYENNSGFEEGLLEKIVNLAYASLAPYSTKKWKITAVKSPVLLQKLSKAADDKRIPECAISLIICDFLPMPDLEAGNEGNGSAVTAKGFPPDTLRSHQDLELLSLSIGYAAKYYCIDSFLTKSFDPEKVKREFPQNMLTPIAIIGLGCFRGEAVSTPLPVLRNYFADHVRVI